MQHAYKWDDETGEVEIVGRGMTAADYFSYVPEDPLESRKAELIDGVMILYPSPLDIHERLYGFLFHLLREYVETFDLGEIRGSRSAVQLAADQVYQPDLLFISRDRLALFESWGILGPPDLVIEILSRSTARYDRGAKLRTYDQTGVREVWLVDPNGPQGTAIYQRQGPRLQPVALDPDGILASVALPGFKLRPSWLWPQGKFIPVREAIASML